MHVCPCACWCSRFGQGRFIGSMHRWQWASCCVGMRRRCWRPLVCVGPTWGFLALAPPRLANPSALTAVAPLALLAQAHEARQALAVVRVSVPVSSIAWRAYRAGADAGPPAAWTDLPNSQRYAWQRTAFTIDLPQDGKGLRVDVQAVAADDGRALPLLRFAIIGPADAAAD